MYAVAAANDGTLNSRHSAAGDARAALAPDERAPRSRSCQPTASATSTPPAAAAKRAQLKRHRDKQGDEQHRAGPVHRRAWQPLRLSHIQPSKEHERQHDERRAEREHPSPRADCQRRRADQRTGRRRKRQYRAVDPVEPAELSGRRLRTKHRHAVRDQHGAGNRLRNAQRHKHREVRRERRSRSTGRGTPAVRLDRRAHARSGRPGARRAVARRPSRSGIPRSARRRRRGSARTRRGCPEGRRRPSSNSAAQGWRPATTSASRSGTLFVAACRAVSQVS